MIVRIMGEGQYRVTGEAEQHVNEVDNRLVDLVEREDREGFMVTFRELLEEVRTRCEHVPDEELIESDVVLPPEDTTFEEARELFSGEGILPG